MKLLKTTLFDFMKEVLDAYQSDDPDEFTDHIVTIVNTYADKINGFVKGGSL